MRLARTLAGDPEQGRAAPVSAAVDTRRSAPRAEQSGSLQPRRAAAGNDFIDQRHLPDPRSPDRVLDGGRDDVTGPHPAAAYPACKALADPDGRGHNLTRKATPLAHAKRDSGPYPDAQERRSTSTEGWNVEGPASPGRR